MNNKFAEFISNYGGLIIGALVGMLLLAVGVIQFAISVIIILACAWCGHYFQHNKETVKEKMKAFIDRI